MATKKKTINDLNSQSFDIKIKLRDRYLGKDDDFFKLSGEEQRRRLNAYNAAKEKLDNVTNGYIRNIQGSEEVRKATAENEREQRRNPYKGGSWDGYLTRKHASITRNTPVSREVYMGRTVDSNASTASKAANGG